MKKKFIAIFALMMLAGITGCRETPEETIVISKAEGLPEDAVIPAVDEEEKKDLGLPKKWTDRLERGDGKITIEADIEFKIDEVSNTPVVEVAREDFTEEQMAKLVDYFSEGRKLYNVPRMTRDELQTCLDMVSEKKGDYGHPDNIYLNGKILSGLKELLNEAEESAELKEKEEIAFTNPVQTEYSYARTGDAGDFYAEQEFIFSAKVEDEVPCEIIATEDCEAVDANALFEYKKGSWFTEEDLLAAERVLPRLKEDDTRTDEWYGEYTKFCENMKTSMEGNSLDVQEIEDKADKILTDLEIGDISLVKSERAVWIPQDLKWNSMDADWPKAEHAYILTFGKGTGGLSAFSQEVGYVLDSLPEQTYSPPFKPEKLTMVFTAEELVDFYWENMSKEVKTIAENTKLLSFEDIKERLADHMLYKAVAIDAVNDLEASDTSNRYVVTDVALRYTNVNAYKAPKNAWLVPVWVFKMDWYLTVQGKSEIFRDSETVMIQAIDGGYVGI